MSNLPDDVTERDIDQHFGDQHDIQDDDNPVTVFPWAKEWIMRAGEYARYERMTDVEVQICIDRWKLGQATAWERQIVKFEYDRLEAEAKVSQVQTLSAARRSIVAESAF